MLARQGEAEQVQRDFASATLGGQGFQGVFVSRYPEPCE